MLTMAWAVAVTFGEGPDAPSGAGVVAGEMAETEAANRTSGPNMSCVIACYAQHG